ncbi:MAG: ATP synthase subunit b [Opitutia bacterium UBA7350]|nr:MAG: ATP synthase subunit b [Opitutae bacterium UBA7350]
MKALILSFLLICFNPFSLFAEKVPHAGAHETMEQILGETPPDGSILDTFREIFKKFDVTWPTLIAQMVNFLLVALVLYKFAVKPVMATLDERQQKIAEGLQYAEEMKEQLAATERARAAKVQEAVAEAQRILSETREQAKQMIEVKTQEAAAQAEAIIRKASEATELERRKMLSEVRQEVARLVVDTSAKVLTRELSADEKVSYSNAAAKELTES